MNGTAILLAFVVAALAGTWFKHGGPFRIIFGGLVLIPLAFMFLATYAVEAPFFAAAVVVGLIIGLIT